MQVYFQVFKYFAFSLLFLALFIVPFILFGDDMERFAQAFLPGDSGDAMVILVAALLLAGDPVLPTPSSVVATLLGARIGFLPAALVNGVALSLACAVGYGVGRSGGAGLARAGRGLPPGFAAWVRRYGLVAALLCRPVPVLAEASLILAGAARHEPVRLLAWCAVTQMALGAAYAYAGSGWGEGRWDAAAILAGSVGIPVAAGLAVAVSLFLSRRRDTKTLNP
ncbi:MAG: VTT domain-containing protein [Oceanicaulis sp.]